MRFWFGEAVRCKEVARLKRCQHGRVRKNSGEESWRRVESVSRKLDAALLAL